MVLNCAFFVVWISICSVLGKIVDNGVQKADCLYVQLCSFQHASRMKNGADKMIVKRYC